VASIVNIGLENDRYIDSENSLPFGLVSIIEVLHSNDKFGTLCGNHVTNIFR
jgi:hypothetical protein